MFQKFGMLLAGLTVLAILASGCEQETTLTAKDETCAQAEQVLAVGKEDYGFPGAVGAINFENGEECVFAVGLSDIDDNIPMMPEHRLLAASIGKTFVAAEVVRLSFEGALNIDDKVAKWLGGRDGYGRIPNSDEITIRHLLSHTGGIPDHVYQPPFAETWSALSGKDKAIKPWRLVSFIFDTDPLFEAGEGFAYTDTGYILLGLIIEKATGKAYYDLAERDFLKPLNLDRTSPTNLPVLSGLTQAYIDGDRIGMNQKEAKAEDGSLKYNAASEWTGGGYVSNPRDLARWVKTHFSGKSMPYDYLDLVLNGSPQPDTDEGKGYGLGVSKYPTDAGIIYGHFGWIPGYVSAAFYVPEQKLSYSFSINTDINLMDGEESNFSKLHKRLLSVIIGRETAQQASP